MLLQQKTALYSIFTLCYTSGAVEEMRTYHGYRLFFTIYDLAWVVSDM
jgi:hypothetical protein